VSSPIPTRHAAGAVAAWLALVAAGHLLGTQLQADDPRIHIGAPPVVGSLDLQVAPGLLGAVVLGLLLLWGAPIAALRLPRRRLLAASWGAGAVWTVVLAASGGARAVSAPLATRYEALGIVDAIETPGRFLESFTRVLAEYPTHVKGHPPGLPLLYWVLDQVGLGGADAAAVLVIGAGALAAPAALVALWELAGEAGARAAAPYVTLAPAAVWLGTSADGLYAGVAAVGIAAFVLGAVRDSWRAAAGAGVVLGVALHLSYGVAPLGLLVIACAVQRRAWRSLAVAAAGLAAVTGAFVAAGFWWFDGLEATRSLYYEGVASRRPYSAFLIIAPAAFALAVGPAAAAGLAQLRLTRVAVLPLAAVAALAAADLSGLSRGETERIWLPFAPWVLLATATLRPGRGWLAAQLSLALTLQAVLRSPW
jgi:hypothetical protein